MLIGYARVSTDDQDTAAQVAALKAAGCERIYREKASGGRWDRPELHRLLDQLRKGDVLVVWKLDRLSRSLRDVLTIMERLGEAGAGFRSLTEAIDTTTPAGRMMMQMVGAFAEFERAMLRERTKAGLDSARRDGRIGGRRPKLTPQQQAEIRRWFQKAARRPPTLRACSKFTLPPSRGYWRGTRLITKEGRVCQIMLTILCQIILKDPKFIPSHNTWASAQEMLCCLNEAIGHYEKALRSSRVLQRDRLLDRRSGPGRFRDALAATRRRLGRLPQVTSCVPTSSPSQSPRSPDRAGGPLPVVLKGEEQARGHVENLEFGEPCGISARRSAARLYGLALAASPQLAADLRAVDRYPGAPAPCAAGSNRDDGSRLSRAERARCARPARELASGGGRSLRMALDAVRTLDRILVRDSLTHLLADPDLPGRWNREPLDELSWAETPGRSLAPWSEIDALIRRRQVIN